MKKIILPREILLINLTQKKKIVHYFGRFSKASKHWK